MEALVRVDIRVRCVEGGERALNLNGIERYKRKTVIKRSLEIRSLQNRCLRLLLSRALLCRARYQRFSSERRYFVTIERRSARNLPFFQSPLSDSMARSPSVGFSSNPTPLNSTDTTSLRRTTQEHSVMTSASKDKGGPPVEGLYDSSSFVSTPFHTGDAPRQQVEKECTFYLI